MRRTKTILPTGIVLGLLLLAPAPALAHCDGLDGPVVKAAQRALDAADPDLVLIWVRTEDEAEIRAAFERALEVRALGAAARELADRYFFETVVRVHRAGEGAPYTGLKPAGRDLGPAIPAADRALEDGSPEPVLTLLVAELGDGLRRHFEETEQAKRFRPDDVEAGRRFVRAYVEFIHYVERLHEAISAEAGGHFDEHR